MFLVHNKNLLWIIVIWFAVLQMLSPLIHAHVEIDGAVQGPSQSQSQSESQGHGLHVHIDELAFILDTQASNTAPAFKDFSASSHIIGVNKARLKKVELLQAPFFTVLFAISVLTIFARQIKVKPKFSNLLSLIVFLQSKSRPRAPPYF